MPGTYGSAYSSTDELVKAPGSSVDSGARVHRNVFNFADTGVGGTTNAVIAARVPRGSTVIAVRMASDQNISGTNFTVGNASAAAKYAAATAGGAADVTKRFDIKTSALDDDPLTAMEEVLITPSANWPAAGRLVAIVETVKR